MSTTDRRDQLKRELAKKAIPFHNVFSSPEGALVLERLKAEFDPSDIVAENAHQTVVKAAQRDVIRYIENMIKLREDNYA
jgi:hypothetical protein